MHNRSKHFVFNIACVAVAVLFLAYWIYMTVHNRNRVRAGAAYEAEVNSKRLAARKAAAAKADRIELERQADAAAAADEKWRADYNEDPRRRWYAAGNK